MYVVYLHMDDKIFHAQSHDLQSTVKIFRVKDGLDFFLKTRQRHLVNT
jgi:hypothetical protein